jgi:hypothetical protein
MENRFLRNEVGLYFLALLFTALLTGALLCTVPGYDIHVPKLYIGDALFSGMSVKTIIDTGWFLTNPYLSAPGTLNMADFPLTDSSSFIIIKFLSLFSHDYAVVINLFYYSTFCLNALISLFAFRLIGLNRSFSFVATMLFVFLPYSLMRNEGHLFLNTIYVIPIFSLLALSVFDRDYLSFIKNKFLKYALIAIAILFAASSGVYYAFFACYFLVIAGVFTSINQAKWSPLVKSMIFIALISSVVILNMAPTFIQKSKIGENAQVAHRGSHESEYAALKIIQMVLPVSKHRVGILRKWKAKYDNTAPLVTENVTATLGLIGSIGFVFLIILLFLKRELIKNDLLIHLSQLNISAVLLGTMGGFGALLAYMGLAAIRSYNRISVFIAFFALCAFFLFLQNNKPQWLRKKINYMLLAVVILIVGLFDQIPTGLNADYQSIQATFNMDKAFIETVENKMPAGSMVFQLPVAGFPEYPVIANMHDYQHFRGYLHSHHLRWSFGAMTGRVDFAWQLDVSKKPLKEMLNDLCYAGFLGLYINRDGYPDNADKLMQQLKHMLKQNPLMSADKKLVFFDLTSYRNNLEQQEGAVQWQKNTKHMQDLLHIDFTTDWHGFNDFKVGEGAPTLSQSKSSIRVVNTAKNAIPVILSMTITPLDASVKTLHISGDLMKTELNLNQKETRITEKIILSPGIHHLNLTTNSTSDLKDYFKVTHFSIEPIVN